MKRILPPLAVILAAVLWSLDGLLRQHVYALPSLLIVFLEHAIGAALFFPFLIRGRHQLAQLNKKSWFSVLWVALFGGLGGTYFYTKALSYVGYIDLSVVVLLQKLQPLFAIALAAVLLREPVGRRFLLQAVLAVIGGYLVTFGFSGPNWSSGYDRLVASGMALAAAFAWGSSTVMGKHALRRLSFPAMTSVRLSVTALMAGALLLAVPSGGIEVSTDQWLILLAIVLSTGSVAVFVYYYGLKRMLASRASIYELFWPLSAVVLDWTVYGKVLSGGQVLGGLLLIFVSIQISRHRPE